MVFSSLFFIFVFLPVTLGAYYICPKKFRNIIILVSSLIFYAWGEPVYIAIMIFSTIFDYTNGRIIYANRENKKIARTVLVLSLAVNIGLLSFFKYYGFILGNINSIFGLNIYVKTLALPLGISFYTFQTMSYIIDVYRGYIPAQKNFISFATYISMFPQLIAGPIVKYRDVEKELTERRESFKLFGEGTELFVIGLFKKVFIGNNLGAIWSAVKILPAGEISVLTAWVGIICFTFQIYFDFSGYSDMARGLGKMFGFNLPLNFNYPYMSKSITEFWRRWHITLGAWFREYVYIPLGGNRVSRLKVYRNIFIVWFLTGLWHGANWNFILWGLYYGILVTLEKMFLLKLLDRLPGFVRIFYSLFIIIIGWVLFEFENIPSLFAYLGAMFGVGAKALLDNSGIYFIYTNAILFVIMLVCAAPIPEKIYSMLKLKAAGRAVCVALYFAMLFICTAYLVNQSYNPFLYFRF